MAAYPQLIYCAGGNRRFAKIAIDAGFAYGARLPDTVYFPLTFADQDWHHPRRIAYMNALSHHRPMMAVVLDWERGDQLPEVLDWAEEAAQYVSRVIIVPKVAELSRLPRRISGADIVLGYSVRTRYGATQVPAWMFADWPIHLLGGSPQRQMEVWRYLHPAAEVVSADGNMAQLLALRWCQFWVPGTAWQADNRWWPKLNEMGLAMPADAPYEAFRQSCQNIMAAWQILVPR